VEYALVQIVTRAVAVVVLGLALVAPSAAARTGRGATVLAISSPDRRITRLVQLDAATLRATGRSVDARGFTGAWSYSPDGARIVLGNSYVPTLGRPAGLLVVDVGAMRASRRVLVPGELGTIRALVWAAPERVLALLVGSRAGATAAVAIDLRRGRITARASLAGVVMGGRSVRSGLVLLTAPSSGIGQASLVTVDAALRIRSLRLAGIRAGWEQTGEGTDLTIAQREPGLAVDPAGARAFVVGAGEPAAAVDLATLRAAYAPTRSVQAAAKSSVGPVRTAEWLGDGVLAVGGTTYAGLDPQTRRFVQQPAGLTMLDTRTWSGSVADPDASGLVVAGSTAVTAVDGRGLAAFARDGSSRWTGLPGTRVDTVRVLGDRLFVQVNGEAVARILDARTGRQVGTRAGGVPFLLTAPASRVS
jgi:hypothetical protein